MHSEEGEGLPFRAGCGEEVGVVLGRSGGGMLPFFGGHLKESCVIADYCYSDKMSKPNIKFRYNDSKIVEVLSPSPRSSRPSPDHSSLIISTTPTSHLNTCLSTSSNALLQSSPPPSRRLLPHSRIGLGVRLCYSKVGPATF